MSRTKPMRELVSGDIIRFEYEKPGSWMTLKVDYIERHSGYIGCKVVGTLADGSKFEAWGCEADDVDIVEGEKKQ